MSETVTEAQPGTLAHLALDALPYGLAVLDADKVVLSTNRRWRQRREAGVATHPPVGDRFPGAGDEELVDAVEAVLAGERDSYATAAGDLTVRVRPFERGEVAHAVVTSDTGGERGDWPLPAGRMLDAMGDTVQILDVSSGTVYHNEAAVRAYDLEARVVEAEGTEMQRFRERVSEESLAAFDEAVDAVVGGEADERRVEMEVLTESGPAVADTLVSPLAADGERLGAVAVSRDVTSYRSELRELEQRRDARETLFRITALVQDLIGSLVEETRRPAIERMVVDQLDESELYRFALVGRHHPAREDLLELSTAGVDLEVGDGLAPELLADHGDLLRTGEVRVVGLSPYDVPAALGTDAVAVPLTYGSSVYGLLLVGLGRGRLTDRELSAFEVLGDAVGFAINAAKHRALALADLVTELEFRVDGGGGLLAGLSSTLDAEVTVDSVVPSGEDVQLQYLSVDGADVDDVVDAASEADGVRDVRVLDEDAVTLELQVESHSVLLALGQSGATVDGASARDGVARVTAAIAADENARALVETVRAAVPDAELVSKRDVEQEPSGEPAFDAATVGQLTDRQLAALETAYRAGYFENPRESNAEEVAEALDITSPTLHQHLQAAHRKLLSGVFESGRGG
jgi:predicted DNA binding protein/PAS domain-containing protein